MITLTLEETLKRQEGRLKPVINLTTNATYKNITEACKTEGIAKGAIIGAVKKGSSVNGTKYAYLDANDKPVLTDRHLILEDNKKIKNLMTGEIYNSTADAAKALGLTTNSVCDQAKDGGNIANTVICRIINGQEILTDKHKATLAALQNPRKYLAWKIEDVERKEAKQFNNIGQIVEYLGISTGAHINSACMGKMNSLKGYKIAYIDESGNPILHPKHHSTFKKVVQKIMCLNDNKVFDNASQAGVHYGVLNESVARAAKGKARGVRGKDGAKLRFAYIDKNNNPIINEFQGKPRANSYAVTDPNGVKTYYCSIEEIAAKLGLARRRVEKYLKDNTVPLAGYVITKE